MTVAENVGDRAATARLAQAADPRAHRRAARARRASTGAVTARATRRSSRAAQRQRVGLARALAAEPAGDADGRAVRRDRPDHARRASRTSSCGCSRSCGRRSSSSRTTSTRRSSSATASRSCAQGGRLAQYDTPEADPRAPRGRVRRRVRRRRPRAQACSRCTRSTSSSSGRRPTARARRRARRSATRSSLLIGEHADVVVGDGCRRRPRGRSAPRRRTHLASMSVLARSAAPSSRTSGRAARASRTNGWFCTDWVQRHWGDTLQPALVQHIELTLIAVGDRLRPRVRARPASASASACFDPPIGLVRRLPLHDPEPRALPAARAVHRADGDDGRDRARLVHAADPLPEHARRASAPSRRTCSRRRAGMGLTRVPDLQAGRAAARAAGDHGRAADRDGLDRSSLATVAAFVIPKGSAGRSSSRCARNLQDGDPRRGAPRDRRSRSSPTLLLVLAQRALTPWTRVA